MSKKTNYAELFKSIINDESIKITVEELENIIDNELKKNEEEMDANLVEFCLDELSRLKKTDLPVKNGKKVDSNGSVKKHSVWKYLIAALIAIVMFTGALTVSAAIYDVNLFDGIVELYNDYIKIRFDKTNKKATNYELLGSDLSLELAENGISPVLLPQVILTDECQITSIDYEFTDAITTATIHFVYNGNKNFININQYVYESSLPAVDYPSASSEINQINVNGVMVYVFMQSGRGTIAYQDDKTQYVIDLQANLEDTIDFAKSIK